MSSHPSIGRFTARAGGSQGVDGDDQGFESLNTANDSLLHTSLPESTAPALSSGKPQAYSPLASPSLRTMLSNHNVRYTILFNCVDGACFSVWSAQLLPVLVHLLAGDRLVGIIAAISGMAQLASALVAGCLGDQMPRQQVLRVGSICGLIAVLLTLLGVWSLRMAVFYAAQAVWGIYLGIVASSSEALFADSVSTGQRASIYNFKWMMQTLCYIVGYLTALVLLLAWGDTWRTANIQIVMTVGLAAHPIAMCLIFLLQDKYALHDELTYQEVFTKAQLEAERMQASSVTNVTGQSSSGRRPVLDASMSELPRQPQSSVEDGPPGVGQDAFLQPPDDEMNVASIRGQMPSPACLPLRVVHLAGSPTAVPYLVCLVDFLMAVGSGMSMQYLPLFFVHDYSISPTLLYMAYLTVTCTTALASLAVRCVGDRYLGRLPAVIVARAVGTTCLLLMGTMRGTLARLPFMLFFFVIRNSLMNSVMGITRSVIMDCVKKENRAKWSAFESFSSFTWAGSAAIGGYLAEAHGYQFTFTITALFHFCALAMLVPAAIGARHVEKELIRQHHAAAAARRTREVVVCEIMEDSSSDMAALLTSVAK